MHSMESKRTSGTDAVSMPTPAQGRVLDSSCRPVLGKVARAAVLVLAWHWSSFRARESIRNSTPYTTALRGDRSGLATPITTTPVRHSCLSFLDHSECSLFNLSTTVSNRNHNIKTAEQEDAIEDKFHCRHNLQRRHIASRLSMITKQRPPALMLGGTSQHGLGPWTRERPSCHARLPWHIPCHSALQPGCISLQVTP